MLKLFNFKRTYVGYDGKEYVDLAIPSVKVSELEGNRVDTLTQDDNGRLDKFVYKNVSLDLNAIDLVMYANHIFNPFAVKEGDIINVPFDNDGYYHSVGEPELPDGSKYSNIKTGEKELSYAEKVELLAYKGLGIK